MIETYEIVGLVFCFFGSAFFSGSEAVLMSIGVDRTKQLIEEGGAKGRAMNFMASRPNEILNVILVGNNVANIFVAALNTSIAHRLFQDSVVSISVFVTTVLILIFGEIIPKTVGRSKAEALVYPVIRILQLQYYIGYPIIKPTAIVVKAMLGGNAQLRGRLVTKDDIEFMVNKAEKEKTMDSKHLDLLTSILEFPTIKVKDIMIPRSKVKWIDCNQNFMQIIDFIKDDNHSRYPVCDGSLDNNVGFLHVKELSFIRDENEQEHFDVKSLIKLPFFVYEHMKIQAVFDHMNRKKVHLAMVKDENGLVVGIVTLEDIVEEIMGDIQDEHDEDENEIHDQFDIEDLSSTGILVDGSISIRDLDTEFEIKIPLNDNFSTLAGFILDMLGNNFPENGQIIVWEGYSFELTKVQEHQIQEVKITQISGVGSSQITN